MGHPILPQMMAGTLVFAVFGGMVIAALLVALLHQKLK